MLRDDGRDVVSLKWRPRLSGQNVPSQRPARPQFRRHWVGRETEALVPQEDAVAPGLVSEVIEEETLAEVLEDEDDIEEEELGSYEDFVASAQTGGKTDTVVLTGRKEQVQVIKSKEVVTAASEFKLAETETPGLKKMEKAITESADLDITAEKTEMETAAAGAADLEKSRETEMAAAEKARETETAAAAATDLEKTRETAADLEKTGAGGDGIVSSEELSEEESSDEDDEYSVITLVKPKYVPRHLRSDNEELRFDVSNLGEGETERTRIEDEKEDAVRLLRESLQREKDMAARAEAEKLVEGGDGLFEKPSDDDEFCEDEEYKRWLERETAREERDKNERLIRDEETAITQRRRQMTEEERKADDEAAKSLLPKKEDKRQYTFMQKYHHKGAFFQDLSEDPNAEEVYLRDYNAPVGEDAIDKNLLPAPMRLRRGQFGHKGQTKHTHLTDVDTTDFTAPWSNKANSQVYDKHVFSQMAALKNKDKLERPSKKLKTDES